MTTSSESSGETAGPVSRPAWLHPFAAAENAAPRPKSPLRVRIEFATQYRYDEPVSLSVHAYRLFPRVGRSVVVVESDFQTNADAQVSYLRDLFDNEAASCFHPEKTDRLETSLRLEMKIALRDPFDFLLAPHALQLPFSYTADEASVLAPFLSGAPPPRLPFWPSSRPARPTVELLIALTKAFNEGLAYERRDEGTARTPEETLTAGGGACRDFSVLMAASLRGLGLAARLASGYVVETGEREKRAEGALHEWVETYLPGAGWLGLDPTNGTVCDHRHIVTAVGLTAEHIAPTEGRYFHETSVRSEMTSTVHVREIG